jgi:hypothetical protein
MCSDRKETKSTEPRQKSDAVRLRTIGLHKPRGPTGVASALWTTLAATHCRGFLLGALIGFIAVPALGSAVGLFDLLTGHRAWWTENDETPIMFVVGIVGFPLGGLFGATLGAGVDFVRKRDRGSFVALVCMIILSAGGLGFIALVVLGS